MLIFKRWTQLHLSLSLYIYIYDGPASLVIHHRKWRHIAIFTCTQSSGLLIYRDELHTWQKEVNTSFQCYQVCSTIVWPHPRVHPEFTPEFIQQYYNANKLSQDLYTKFCFLLKSFPNSPLGPLHMFLFDVFFVVSCFLYCRSGLSWICLATPTSKSSTLWCITALTTAYLQLCRRHTSRASGNGKNVVLIDVKTMEINLNVHF